MKIPAYWILTVALLLGIFGLCPSAQAQEDVHGEVIAGETGYEMLIQVVNPHDEPAEGVSVRLKNTSPIFTNVNITPATLSEIPPGQTGSFNVQFDVAEEAKSQNLEKMEFSITAEKGMFDQPNPLVTLKILAAEKSDADVVGHCPIDKERASGNWTGPEQHYVFTFYDIQSSKLLRILILTSHANGFVEIAKQSTKDQRYGPFGSMSEAEAQAKSLCGDPEPSSMAGLPVFLLSEVKGTKSFRYAWYEMEWDGKSAGHVERWHTKRGKRVLTDIRTSVITQYPQKIVLGKPFSFTALAQTRHYNLQHCWRRNQKHEEIFSNLGLRSHIATVDVKGRKDLAVFCDEAGVFKTGRDGRKHRISVRSIHKDGQVQATLKFVPTKIIRDDKNRPVEFYYQPQLSTTGNSNEYSGLQERRFFSINWDREGKLVIDSEGYFNQADELVWIDSISFGIIDLKLKYRPATRSTKPLSPPPLKEPEGLSDFSPGEGIGEPPGQGEIVALPGDTPSPEPNDDKPGERVSPPSDETVSPPGERPMPSPGEPVSRENDQEGESVGNADETENQGNASATRQPDGRSSGETSVVTSSSSDDSASPSEEGLTSNDQTPAPSVGDQPVVDPEPYPTSGPYTTTEGELTFLESGLLAARYHQDGGRLVGKFDGLVFTGVWVEDNAGRKCATQQDGSAFWGKVQFTFTEKFDTFKGAWGYCEEVPTHKWDGHRKRSGDTRKPGQASYSSNLAENEPNDSSDKAILAPLPSTLQGSIDPRNDADWYRILVDHQGVLTYATSQMPDPIDLTFQVWNSEKKVMHSWVPASKPGQRLEGIIDLASPGEYFLEVRDSHNNSASKEPYRLDLSFLSTADAGEPNDTLETATPLALEQSIQANILPRNDADWYRLDIPAQGAVEVAITDMPPELDVTFQVWGANKKVVHGWRSVQKAGEDHVTGVDLPAPGTYYLEVRDGHNNARSSLPYTLRARLVLQSGQGIGIDRPGRDYRNFPVSSSSECQHACNAEGKCQAWTYVKPGVQGASARCWLKHSVPEPVHNNCCTSGVK